MSRRPFSLSVDQRAANPELRTALVAGATGLVGGECVRLLAGDDRFGRVIALVRQPSAGLPLPDRVERWVVDFERLDDSTDLPPASHVFCAMGTTMRRAGSRPAFRRVDHDFPVALARVTLRRGARHFLLVSALGARPGSRVFYLRVKGEVEADIRALGFPSVTIVRPSFLVGERAQVRLGEALAIRFAWLMPRRSRPVQVRDVARALIAAAGADQPGVQVIESAAIAPAAT